MRLVHMADLHLGKRQFATTSKSGLNQREFDVAIAFKRVIDKTIELAPELVVVAGDVYDTVRPPSHATDHAMRQFKRLREALPNTDIVMVAGNHDTPRTKDIASPLPIFDTIGIHVALTTKRLSLRGGELSILCVPDHMRPKPEFVPDSSAKYNVLLIHDQVQGESKRYGPAKKPGETVDPSELNAQGFDYIALGDYHVYQEIAPNAFYSGSIEYTSSNIWREVDEESNRPEGRGKGIIERDLATGAHRFHLITSAREIVDLPVINATGVTPDALSDAICAAADAWPGGIDDKVVRQVVTDVPKYVVRDLDHPRIRVLKARALNYQLDTRIP
jgi:DNA repair protein SbcD/Mre11